mmetsp:Transcript_75374/g.140585  ORF Transcript_75374/g.140585 Transcript_75374/m.140585 type:complete len:451 (+) Transcript_75374:50-1402(+)
MESLDSAVSTAASTTENIGSHVINRSAQEQLSYIQEKVNPILEALVTAVLLERPEDPAGFMLKWLSEQTKTLEGASQVGTGAATGEEIATVRAEIDRLKARKAELLAKLQKNFEGDLKMDFNQDNDATTADEAQDDEEDEDDDDDMEDVPMPSAYLNRGQRQSVSAEAYGQWNQKEVFEPPVYPKTEEQKERIKGWLEKSFLFNSLEKEDLETVILAVQDSVVDEGTRLIQQGDDGESMFLVEAGRVRCLKEVDGHDVVVKECHAGDVFGELALLYNCPRAASVESIERTTVWELDRQTFTRIVKDSAAKKRDMYAEFFKKMPLLKSMDQYEMLTIADASKVEFYPDADTVVISQGAVGDKFYIVVEGECVAKKSFVAGDEPRPVMWHKVADYFGELSLIENEPRAATVITTTPGVKLLSMDRRTFKRLLGPIEDILRREKAVRYETFSS